MSDSIFNGIEDVQSRGSSNYFKDGRYLVEVQKFTKGNSQRGEGAYTVAEFSVLETLVDQGESNKPGEVLSWVVMMKHGASALSNIKNFLAAVTHTSEQQITVANADKAVEGDGTALAGMRVLCQANTIPTTRGGKFTKVNFEAYAAE